MSFFTMPSRRTEYHGVLFVACCVQKRDCLTNSLTTNVKKFEESNSNSSSHHITSIVKVAMQSLFGILFGILL